MGQLVGVTNSNGHVIRYVYDGAGNRRTVIDNGVSTPYNAAALNQYARIGDEILLYDTDGNLTNRHSALGSRALNQLHLRHRKPTHLSRHDHRDRIYAYDALGNRGASTHNGQTTRYVTDPAGLGNVAAEYDDSGNLIARYEHGFGLLSRTDAAGSPAFYTFSAIGHTSELTKQTGSVADSYAYDPFGISLAKTETIPNPFVYVGECGVRDEGNGLHFMRARFYDGACGRFVSTDPEWILGGLNRYTYALNSAVHLRDPSGLFSGPDSWLSYDETRNTLRGPFSEIQDPGREVETLRRAYEKQKFEEAFRRDPNWYQRYEEQADALDELPVAAVTLSIAFITGQGIVMGVVGYANVVGPLISPIPPTLPGQKYIVQTGASADPNDKFGPAGFGAARFVRLGDKLAYQVRFENLSSATAPAREVVVRDILDPHVDVSALELSEISFGSHILSVPPGTDRYQTLVPVSSSGTTLQVKVQASLDYSTRTLTMALSALDPLTGWYPEDPMSGLLPPEDGTGRGQGSITYSVSPRNDTPTGTVITNRARIWFDYNDPIDTPLVFNTIDVGAPDAAVSLLPSEVGRTFPVRWAGHDDPGGSGIANYDVFVSTNGQSFVRWLSQTTTQSAWYVGQPGQTYSFYAVARDNVGNEQSAPSTAQAETTVSTNAPVLALVTATAAMPGSGLAITNSLASGFPVGALRFSLGPGAPTGATINETNGVFRWTPTCSQASHSYAVTVWVTDTGNTNMMDASTFAVAVSECVVPSLGQLVLRAGDSGRLPSKPHLQRAPDQPGDDRQCGPKPPDRSLGRARCTGDLSAEHHVPDERSLLAQPGDMQQPVPDRHPASGLAALYYRLEPILRIRPAATGQHRRPRAGWHPGTELCPSIGPVGDHRRRTPPGGPAGHESSASDDPLRQTGIRLRDRVEKRLYRRPVGNGGHESYGWQRAAAANANAEQHQGSQLLSRGTVAVIGARVGVLGSPRRGIEIPACRAGPLTAKVKPHRLIAWRR